MSTEIYTSYFYQIRNFKPNMIPLSTAVWDPKWYHNFKRDENYHFVDKNGVLNGLRMKQFVPNHACYGLCNGVEICQTKDPAVCDFLKMYKYQLSKLDISDVLNTIFFLTKDWCENPIPVLIVYETPDKACSERRAIQEYFNERGVSCRELQYPIGG